MEKCTAGKGNSLLSTLYLAVNSEVSSKLRGKQHIIRELLASRF